jgi:hypothetical protein
MPTSLASPAGVLPIYRLMVTNKFQKATDGGTTKDLSIWNLPSGQKSLHNGLRLRFKGNEYEIYYIPSSSKVYLISKDMLLRQPLPPYDYDIEDCNLSIR